MRTCGSGEKHRTLEKRYGESSRERKIEQLRNQPFLGQVYIVFTLTFVGCVFLFCKYVSQFSSVAQSCPTLCDPMNRSTPGLPVHHQPPEFTQTHIHRVSDAIQPSHPLLSPSPLAPNPSQHQSLFQ